MPVAFKTFSDWVGADNAEGAENLFSNVLTFVNRYSHNSVKPLTDEDSGNLFKFLDEFLGLSVGAFLDHCGEPFSDVTRLFSISATEDITSVTKHAGVLPWSTSIGLCLLNQNVVTVNNNDLVYDKSSARKALSNPDSTSSLKAYLSGFKFNVEIPKEVDFLGLAYLAINTAFAHDNPCEFKIPRSFQAVMPSAMNRRVISHYQNQAESIAEEFIAPEITDDDDIDYPADDDDSGFDPLDDGDYSGYMEDDNNPDGDEYEESSETNYLQQQKQIAKSVFGVESLEERLGDPESVAQFIQNFEPSAEFISSIQRNAQSLVLGLTSLMTEKNDPADHELLLNLQKRISEFRSDDENLLFGLILTGAFEAAYSRTIKDAQQRLSSVPEEIRETITKDISEISEEARRSTRKLTEDMSAVTRGTVEWSKEMGVFIESCDEFIETLPEKITAKLDEAIKSQTDKMFIKAATILKKSEDSASGLGAVAEQHITEIQSKARKEKRSLITIAVILVPILTVVTYFMVSWFTGDKGGFF